MTVAEILNALLQNNKILQHVDQTQSLFTSFEHFSKGKLQINSWMHLCYKAGSRYKEGVELQKLLCDNKA